MANQLKRYSPFGDLARYPPFRNLDDIFSSFGLMPYISDIGVESRLKIDISGTDSACLVKADAPGVPKDDIKVSVDGNLATIEFEVKKEPKTKKKVK